jgi:hypothetical protein
MAEKFKHSSKSPVKNNFGILFLLAAAGLLCATGDLRAQSPTPTPAQADAPVMLNGFEVTSVVELGFRGVSVNGNDNKYRSDFNYRPGFRFFDSSFLMENKEKTGRFFDTLQITSSGWNADPTGSTRFSMEKVGLYRFESSIRQVNYFNNLNNHARNGHTADTRHDFSDFDLTVYPSKLFRLRFGASFNRTNGTGSITSRAYSDEFPADSRVDSGANDFRAGIDSTLLGFNLSFSSGFRHFRDNTYYSTRMNPGYNTTNTTVINTFDRSYPIEGDTKYAFFSAQRTFAKRLDFTARVIYSNTDRHFGFIETITGRDNNNNIVDSDTFNVSGDTERPQTRADVGVTYAVTRHFRISDTFTYDTFNITGGNAFYEGLYTRTATGGPRAPTITNNLNNQITDYRRYVNTIEGDYQFSDRFGFNIGYRYTNRKVELSGLFQPLPPASPTTPTLSEEVNDNQTNTWIAGFRAKPLKNWVIFFDVETGDSDNAFTRLANYNFTNLRLRTRWSINKFAINFSAISKDNDNPSTSTAPPGGYPTGDFFANTKINTYSISGDWNPISRFSLTAGYTYQHQTSITDIVINTGSLVRGVSQYFMRDHYGFFDISAQPFRRVTFFAGYRHNEDLGQGDRTAALPILITSYPFRLMTAESRVAFRLTRHIEWNIGYQYIGYNETMQPLSVGGPQDYHANLPYTSLKIYFGGGEPR